MRERQLAAALFLPSLYLKLISNSCRAKSHRISLALRGEARVNYVRGL